MEKTEVTDGLSLPCNEGTKQKPKLSETINYDREIAPYPFIHITSGVGSGKNYFADHLMLGDTFKHQDGTLVGALNILIISPRRSKVNETLRENEDDYCIFLTTSNKKENDNMQTMIYAEGRDRVQIINYLKSRNATAYPYNGNIIEAYWPESKISYGTNIYGRKYLTPDSEYISIHWGELRNCENGSVVLEKGQVQLDAINLHTVDNKQHPWLVNEYKALQRWIQKNTTRIPFGNTGFYVYVFPEAMKKLEGKTLEKIR